MLLQRFGDPLQPLFIWKLCPLLPQTVFDFFGGGLDIKNTLILTPLYNERWLTELINRTTNTKWTGQVNGNYLSVNFEVSFFLMVVPHLLWSRRFLWYIGRFLACILQQVWMRLPKYIHNPVKL